MHGATVADVDGGSCRQCHALACPPVQSENARTGSGREKMWQSPEKECADTVVFRATEVDVSNEGESLASLTSEPSRLTERL